MSLRRFPSKFSEFLFCFVFPWNDIKSVRCFRCFFCIRKCDQIILQLEVCTSWSPSLILPNLYSPFWKICLFSVYVSLYHLFGHFLKIDSMEKEMATHSNILACKVPWKEEPGGLQSIGSQRVGHNWAHAHTCVFVFLSRRHVLAKIIAFTENGHAPEC